MSEALTEGWYRLFLRAFPHGHRAEYGAEMIGTLMSEPTRRLPSARETAGLVTAGFTARARRATPAPWWADGVHLGLLTLALANLGYGVADHVSLGWLATSAALAVALLRGRARIALPLALAVAFSTGRAMLFGPEATGWARSSARPTTTGSRWPRTGCWRRPRCPARRRVPRTRGTGWASPVWCPPWWG